MTYRCNPANHCTTPDLSSPKHHSRGQMRTSQTTHDLSRPLRHVDPFGALVIDWQATTARGATRRAIVAWSAKSPALAGFASAAAVVDTVNRPGEPERSCALLSELLIIAVDDELAARAVLQAIIPGLRRAARNRWTKAAAGGPWRTEHELAADAISAAWQAIRRHSGQRHQRPAALIIRRVETALRQDHRRWCHHPEAVLPLSDIPEASLPQEEAYSAEECPVRLIADAARTGIIDRTDAALVLAVGVAGYTTVEAATALGVPSRFTAARRLRNARLTMLRRTGIAGGPQLNSLLDQRDRGPMLTVRVGNRSQRAHP